MCDTLVAIADGAVWFAKNSDREPGEAQIVEHHPPRRSRGRLSATYVELDDVEETYEVVISRPYWMWGAEMGANARGVVVGNEAVFTKMPVEDRALLGMDLVRIALERASSAEHALAIICELIERVGQGGAAGHRDKSFRYHNAFLIADPREAWVLETAGRFWAAERVRTGARTISNVLSIGGAFDRVAGGAFEHARSRGWCRDASDFDFARCFGDRFYSTLSGGDVRRACTARLLASGAITRAVLFAALRDHGGRRPEDGWRMEMACAHASWQPTRHAGQTTASMVSRLAEDGCAHWLTGTSSPCISVFKPVSFGAPIACGPAPAEGWDPESLFWRHERLHRAVLEDYARRAPLFAAEREALESRGDPSVWVAHREAIPRWTELVLRDARRSHRAPLFDVWWAIQSRRDRLPRTS